MKTYRATSQGFTLVEMIVALVIASLLAVVVVSGLHLGIRSWEAVSNKVTSGNTSHSELHALRRVLSKAVPERVRDNNGLIQAAFYGASNQVLFVAPLEQLGGINELYWIMLRMQSSEDGQNSLMLYRLSHSADTYFDEDDQLAENIVWEEKIDELLEYEGIALLEGTNLQDIKFEYLRIDNNGEPIWEEEWIDDAQLPKSIKVNLYVDADEEFTPLYVLTESSAYEFKKLL